MTVLALYNCDLAAVSPLYNSCDLANMWAPLRATVRVNMWAWLRAVVWVNMWAGNVPFSARTPGNLLGVRYRGRGHVGVH